MFFQDAFELLSNLRIEAFAEFDSGKVFVQFRLVHNVFLCHNNPVEFVQNSIVI